MPNFSTISDSKMKFSSSYISFMKKPQYSMKFYLPKMHWMNKSFHLLTHPLSKGVMYVIILYCWYYSQFEDSCRLGCYFASTGIQLPTFRRNTALSSSGSSPSRSHFSQTAWHWRCMHCSFEMAVNYLPPAQLNIPEDFNLQQQCCENLEPTKSICWRMQLSYYHFMTLLTFLRRIRNSSFTITFISHFDYRYEITITVFLLAAVRSDQH
jgi:hypothetical protein